MELNQPRRSNDKDSILIDIDRCPIIAITQEWPPSSPDSLRSRKEDWTHSHEFRFGVFPRGREERKVALSDIRNEPSIKFDSVFHIIIARSLVCWPAGPNLITPGRLGTSTHTNADHLHHNAKSRFMVSDGCWPSGR